MLKNVFAGRLALSVLAVLSWVGTTGLPVAEKPLDLFDQGEQTPGVAGIGDPVVTARLSPASARPGDDVTLSVTVILPPGHYTYPTDASFGKPTRILIHEAVGLKPIEEQFRADHPPKVVDDPIVGRVKKYVDEVTWSRRYRIDPHADLEQVTVRGELDYQVCDASRCTPLHTAFQAFLSDDDGPPKPPATSFDPALVHPLTFEERPQILNKPTPAMLRLELAPEDAQSGDEVTLRVTIELDSGWHVYATTQEKGPGALPTSIRLEKSAGLVPIGGAFTPGEPPESKTLNLSGEPQKFLLHEGTVTWTRRFRVQPSVPPGGYGVEGTVRYLTCTDTHCLRPMTISFALGNLNNSGEVPAALPAEESAADTGTYQEVAAAGSLPLYLLYAFLGGLILNVMPCVLPVIAIKVMSFVQQAGESRGRILALNVAYGAGVVGVFFALATLAVVLGLGWGGLFRNSTFNLVMACLVFAMGLSLLGVFEIPVPGFVGTAAGRQQQEGLLGAFLTGILATLLATPCSGPLLGVTLGWSVRQSPQVTYLVWGVMGFGMASPYLVFGLFPAALKWLPKPGTWMVRLKEFAGFVLMGTVIFFIYFTDKTYTIPLLVMLLGIALGLWMIGNLYDVNSHIRHKLAVRVTALVLTGAICLFGFSLAKTGKADEGGLPWQAFSEQRLNELRAQNKTVLVDFTADW